MNVWDILILLAVAGAAVLGLRRTRKRKAAGKGGCCEGSCGSCALCKEQNTCEKNPRS